MLVFKSCPRVISPRFFFQFQNPSNWSNQFQHFPFLSLCWHFHFLSLCWQSKEGLPLSSLLRWSWWWLNTSSMICFGQRKYLGVSRQSRMRLDNEISKRWWIYFVVETFVCLTISSHPPMDPDILSCGRYLPAHPSETSNKLHSCSRGGSTSNESQKSKRGNFLLISWEYNCE